MVGVYNFFIRLYTLAIRLAAPFNRKAWLWTKGRQGVFTRLKKDIDQSKPLVWMHCASLGEFEQGLPVLERFKADFPEFAILITFFSPSGYEIRKNHPIADHVYYLPPDTPCNAEKFIDIIRPELVIFVRYEFWHHYLSVLSERKIPLVLLSAIFRPGQVFFRPWGGFFRDMLRSFDMIFVQDDNSEKLLSKFEINKVQICGDTRVDRVCHIADDEFSDPLITAFAGNANLLIAGSTWPPDETILVPFINEQKGENWKFVIAPHNIDADQIRKLEKALSVPVTLYSNKNIKEAESSSVLIIDNIGLLSRLYRYGRIAYIGGGFGVSTHNILEALVYGLPVIFGPKYKHIREACLMVEADAAIPVNGKEAFATAFTQLTESNNYQKAKEKIETFILENKGATDAVMVYLLERMPR